MGRDESCHYIETQSKTLYYYGRLTCIISLVRIILKAYRMSLECALLTVMYYVRCDIIGHQR